MGLFDLLGWFPVLQHTALGFEVDSIGLLRGAEWVLDDDEEGLLEPRYRHVYRSLKSHYK